jgi:hypothetical protein
MIRVYLFDWACRIFFLDNAKDAVLKRAETAILGMKEHIDFLMTKIEEKKQIIKTHEDTIKRIDRGTSLDVRSSLELLNFEGMGEIIWIKVADDRMLRYDVFNQIRDWMRTHDQAHAVLMVTGTNVQFQTLTEKDLIHARLKRMTKQESDAVTAMSEAAIDQLASLSPEEREQSLGS